MRGICDDDVKWVKGVNIQCNMMVEMLSKYCSLHSAVVKRDGILMVSSWFGRCLRGKRVIICLMRCGIGQGQ